MNKVVVRCRSSVLEKSFRDAISNLRWIENPDVNQRSLTELDMWLECNTVPDFDEDLDYDSSIVSSTENVRINLNMIDCFELDISGLLLKIGVDQDEIRYFEMELRHRDDLTSENLEFIHGCHYTRLRVSRTLPEVYNHLVDIIWNSLKLEDLHIDCHMEHFISTINLVLSIRERVIQDRDSLSLRTLTVCEYLRNKSTVTFLGDSQLFDMRSSLSFFSEEMIGEVDPMIDFVRRYGWSIEDLSLSLSSHAQLAAPLWDSIQERGSRMKTLSIELRSLTTSTLNIFDQIIGILPRSTIVRLDFHSVADEDQLENMLHLLRLCKEIVNHLGLIDDSMKLWLPRLTQEFPDRTSFPMLSSFSVGCDDYRSEMPAACVPWTIAMLSIPPDQSLPSTPLESIRLEASLQHDDWRTVLETLDLSTLKELLLEHSNFSLEELELLVNRIVDSDAAQVRMTTVSVNRKLFHNDVLKELRARLVEKAPNVKIYDWLPIRKYSTPRGSMSETTFQESSSKALSIPIHFDTKTKQFVVWWKDFQECFENAKRVMNEEAAILFVSDDDLQDPPSLTFTSGVVFKLIVTDKDKGSSSLTGVPDSTTAYESSQPTNVVGSYNTHSSSMITRDDIHSMEYDTDNMCFEAHSQGLPSRTPTPLIAYSELGTAFHHDTSTPYQVNAGASSIPITDGQIDTMQWETNINMAPQEHLHRLQQQMDTALQEVQQCGDILHKMEQCGDILQKMEQTGQQAHGVQRQQMDIILQKIQQMDRNTHRLLQIVHEMDRGKRRRLLSSPQQTPTDGSQDYQLEKLRIQKQGFEHFVIILSRAQALLAKSFEELPMPRLFIVLPKATGNVNGQDEPHSAQFRLYYLCECGGYTVLKESKGAHMIHIANHPGYDLDNHDEFFDT
ncbi:hypothetical protein BGZ65_007685, partial [Modicella reniformis]